MRAVIGELTSVGFDHDRRAFVLRNQRGHYYEIPASDDNLRMLQEALDADI